MEFAISFHLMYKSISKILGILVILCKHRIVVVSTCHFEIYLFSFSDVVILFILVYTLRSHFKTNNTPNVVLTVSRSTNNWGTAVSKKTFSRSFFQERGDERNGSIKEFLPLLKEGCLKSKYFNWIRGWICFPQLLSSTSSSS